MSKRSNNNMAKIAFTKLNLIKDTSVKILDWQNQKIEVKQFLSTKDKLDLISRVINLSVDDHVFYNPCNQSSIKLTL